MFVSMADAFSKTCSLFVQHSCQLGFRTPLRTALRQGGKLITCARSDRTVYGTLAETPTNLLLPSFSVESIILHHAAIRLRIGPSDPTIDCFREARYHLIKHLIASEGPSASLLPLALNLIRPLPNFSALNGMTITKQYRAVLRQTPAVETTFGIPQSLSPDGGERFRRHRARSPLRNRSTPRHPAGVLLSIGWSDSRLLPMPGDPIYLSSSPGALDSQS
ncbi:hypothetical protein SISNIDRAFT_470894 [Sistotremastrum niveocremeum HHB9708]|uniref:Uncharacterized protein n=1 Tax=Sistotremastrum niveocremeum HHB9708 TaxID=1314777 RepID=A0A164NB51_9AGAM|nr:hypothetical protein SISNIDRAFT_470894 [Sistotremastrum niveocremeum HHB9708]